MNEHDPFLDLITMHHDIEDDCGAVFRHAPKTGQFIGGSTVEMFGIRESTDQKS